VKFYKNLITGSHNVPCGWMDGQRWQTTVTWHVCFANVPKTYQFHCQHIILFIYTWTLLSNSKGFFCRNFKENPGTVQEFSATYLITHWNLLIIESQGTKILFLCRQFPFNTATWSMDHQDSRSSNCKISLLKTDFCYAQVLFKAGLISIIQNLPISQCQSNCILSVLRVITKCQIWGSHSSVDKGCSRLWYYTVYTCILIIQIYTV
jgi:hypothetical protein